MSEVTAKDFFALFNLKRRLVQDPEALKTHYLELSRKWHPDHHRFADLNTRRERLDQFSRLNHAFTTLNSPLTRAEHLLDLEQVNVGKQAATPGFLNDILRAREESDPSKLSAALTRFTGKLGEIEVEMEALFRAWDGLAEKVDSDSERRQAERFGLAQKIKQRVNEAKHLAAALESIAARLE